MSHSGPSTFQDEGGYLQDLALTIRQTDLGQGEANWLLIRAWETAALGALEDGLLSLDEENALARYADHFSLAQQDLDRNGVQTSLVKAAVLRDVTQGIIPKRHRVSGAVRQQLQRPTGPALRRFRAGLGNQVGFPLTVQLLLAAVELRPASQRSLQTLRHAAPPHPFHRGAANPEGPGNVFTLHGPGRLGLIAQQQDTGPGLLVGRRPTGQ